MMSDGENKERQQMRSDVENEERRQMMSDGCHEDEIEKEVVGERSSWRKK
jgi:hypothetical protein